MIDRRMILGLFVAACLVQLAVPVTMVFRAEQSRAHGDVYRFRCAPVDPTDPFRGRYVALGFDVERNRIPTDGSPFAQDDQAFATLAVDADGFARIVRLTRKPQPNAVAIRVRVRQPRDGMATVDLPFDRYFLNEAIAPETERAYRKALSNGGAEAWAEVSVRGTQATLVGLSIDGVPAEDYVRSTVTP